MPFDAALFDLDGLLLDTERVSIEAGRQSFAALGQTVSEAFLKSLVGIDNTVGIARINAHLGTAFSIERVDTLWVEASNALMEKGVPERPGARKALDAILSSGLPMAIATNSSTERAHFKLDRSPLAGLVPVVIGYDQVAKGKPAPDVYLAAAAALHVVADGCIAFEDSDPGVRAAKAAGTTVVQIPDIVASTEHRADHTCATLAEAMEWAGLHAKVA